jgi:hypothetical protein
MGGPFNTLINQAPFIISSMAKPPCILQMACAAWLLKVGDGPVIHDIRIRIASQGLPEFPRLIWRQVLFNEKGLFE